MRGPRTQHFTGKQPWYVSGFDENGGLKSAWTNRLRRVLDAAQELSMAAILGLFYFGQDQRLLNDAAVKRATENAVDWLMHHDYRNVLIEIANECDHFSYDHEIIRPHRVAELIQLAREVSSGELLISTSFCGGVIPPDNVLRAVDFVLLHGN